MQQKSINQQGGNMNENTSIQLTPEQEEKLDFYLWVSEMEAIYGNIYR